MTSFFWPDNDPDKEYCSAGHLDCSCCDESPCLTCDDCVQVNIDNADMLSIASMELLIESMKGAADDIPC